ncbi:pyridoxal-dependent decarboxylase [Hyphobacterium sp. HN65]|uniref:Pyridoxal-dependent decarboxylase n=1 Tax=Hyphobacterium lacteum TaxID=3116575 RepID=A0ABU7LPZ0_9PROT|nr:pyridoxal-dependent decarboxylase [Hyphobacterium sp. HN65]MEE2525691.1 pyridoxal-dependent decarboxylase [Hyphobacterium sp. HN65]
MPQNEVREEFAHFLGPGSENGSWFRSEFQAVLDQWFDWRRDLFAEDPSPLPKGLRRSPGFLAEREQIGQKLAELCDRLTGEVPKYTPRYIGHMVSEVSIPALLGHFATLLHNPNNTSRDVARVSGAIEDEAIGLLAAMIGFDPDTAQGHFTSGGTLANFECVWRARYRMDHFLSLALAISEQAGEPLDPFAAGHMGWKRYHALAAQYGFSEEELRKASAVVSNPFEAAERIGKASGQPWRGPVLLVPGNKHFSWLKAANVFGLGEEAFWPVSLDANGRLDPAALDHAIGRARSAGRPVLAVITVAGTTEAGEIDPVDTVCDRLEALRAAGIDVWHHVDAAWGGFLCSMLGGEAETVLEGRSRTALRAIRRVNSVTLDPHKLGYVPYACGAFLVRDHENYANSLFAAPYIDRALANDRWMMTLEGSRSGAGASAVWLTGQTLSFRPDRFGAMMAGTIDSCRFFARALQNGEPLVRPLIPTDSNIFCFSLAKPGEALSVSNERTASVFRAFTADPEFSVSKTVLSRENYGELINAHVARYGGEADTDSTVLLRCVFMNPFWREDSIRAALMPRFIERLQAHMN